MNEDNIRREHNILEIAEIIAEKLKINSAKFKNIIINKIPDEKDRIINDSSLLNKISLLIKSDDEINKFESKLKNIETIKNFGIMKEKLAELQVLALVKKLEKSDTCDDVINSFLVVLNNKFEGVNSVLADSLNQAGGGGYNNNYNSNNINGINYYSKYLKYKLKNIELQIQN